MTNAVPPQRPYILGLDIGANSIGWVCLAAEPDGLAWEPTGLLQPATEMHRWPTLGVRIFPEGVADFDQKSEEGPGAARRRARHMRRQTARRARRMAKTFRTLQELGLLPAYSPDKDTGRVGPERPARDRLLKTLDAELAEKWRTKLGPAHEHRAHDLLPYVLRRAAIYESLERFELGRALYHLSQRRGFLSNRKDAEGEKREEESEAKQAGASSRAGAGKKLSLKDQTSALLISIQENGHKSLGEHLLWRVTEQGGTIRGLKTMRFMYRDEFDKIWEKQAQHHGDVLDAAARERVYRAIFYQRPLRSQAKYRGLCSLEDGENLRVDEHGVLTKTRPRTRAPLCSLTAQRFRALQRLNDVRLTDKETGEQRGLSPEERTRLLGDLQTCRSMTTKEAAKLLGWSSKKYGVFLNFDDKTGDALPGMPTNAQILEHLGDRWKALTFEQQEAIVHDLFTRPDPRWYEEDPDDPTERERDPALVEAIVRGEEPWSCLRLTRTEAMRLIEVRLSSEYASHSATAMHRLMPLLEDGVAYKTAVDRRYKVAEAPVSDRLPPVENVFRSVNNPVVMRALTELRRVVNQLVPLYGRPEQIRIEVTREVKQGRKGREAARDAQTNNRREKQKAVDAVCRELGIDPRTVDDYSPRDIEKIRLWHEQGTQCPYTGRQINARSLKDTEVDHVIPFSRSQDDSYSNKVLVFAEANHAKGNQTPREAFESNPEIWSKIEAWVRSRRKAKAVSSRKLDRILMTKEQVAEYLSDFGARQLNDTGWATSWARRYLMRLYGGQIVNGIDPQGRRRILSSSGQSSAHLRRELGMDALLKEVIDASVPRPQPWTKRIDHRHHIVDALAVAWCGPRMHAQLSSAAQGAKAASRRFFAKLAPIPFQEEFKSALRACVPSFRINRRVRGALHKETIHSPKLVQRGEIKSYLAVGEQSHRRRIVSEAGNHHMLVVVKDLDGKLGITGKVVSDWEAAQRLAEQRRRKAEDHRAPYEHPPGAQFTLGINDVVEVSGEDGTPSRFLRVAKLMANGQVGTVPVHDSRTLGSPGKAAHDEAARAKFLITNLPVEGHLPTISTLVRKGCRKLSVTPIGTVRPSRA